jgi:flagellin
VFRSSTAPDPGGSMALIIPPNTSSTAVDTQLGPSSAAKTTGKTVHLGQEISTPRTRPAPSEELTISDAMRIQIRSLASAERSANDGIAMAQVADEALGRLGGLLAQMRDLASQAASPAGGQANGETALEFSRLQAEVARIQAGATYDGRPLLGAEAVEVGFDVVWESGTSDRFSVTLGGLEPLAALAADAEPVVKSLPASVVGRIDDALAAIADKRARFAASVNRFASATAAVQVARANHTGGSSPLENARAAEELAQLSKLQILGQGLGATLMQANQLPSQAMSLLQD